MTLIPVTVHGGTYRGYDQQPTSSGVVTFTPLAGWVADATDVLDYVPAPVKQEIADGAIQVTLLAPSVVGDGDITYRVDVHIQPDLKDSYIILMPVNPADGAVLELSSRDPATGLLAAGSGGGGGGGFGGGGHGGFGD